MHSVGGNDASIAKLTIFVLALHSRSSSQTSERTPIGSELDFSGQYGARRGNNSPHSVLTIIKKLT